MASRNKELEAEIERLNNKILENLADNENNLCQNRLFSENSNQYENIKEGLRKEAECNENIYE